MTLILIFLFNMYLHEYIQHRATNFSSTRILHVFWKFECFEENIRGMFHKNANSFASLPLEQTTINKIFGIIQLTPQRIVSTNIHQGHSYRYDERYTRIFACSDCLQQNYIQYYSRTVYNIVFSYIILRMKWIPVANRHGSGNMLLLR